MRHDNESAASNAADTFAADADSLAVVLATPDVDVDMNDTGDETVVGTLDADEIFPFFADGCFNFAAADAAVVAE